jgi:hypothetical protein
LDVELIKLWVPPTKAQILAIATELKTKFGEGNKKIIINIITLDLNQAT